MPFAVTVAYLFFLYTAEPTVLKPHYDWLNAVLCLPMLLLLHGGGNLLSDYRDHEGLVDLPGSLNGVRTMESGLFTPRQIRRYGLSLVAAGFIVGLVILCRTGIGPLWIGVAAVLLVGGYSWMKAHALGDVNVLLSFALLPAIGICRVTTGTYHPETLLLSLPYGLLTVSILHANNTRDIANDGRAGLLTFPIMTGWRVAAWVYVAELVLPYMLATVFALVGYHSDDRWLCLLIVFVTLPLAVRNCRTMLGAQPGAEQDIATLDHASAQLQFLFGCFYTLAFILGGVPGLLGGVR